jgi:hypothetical protein
MNIGINDPLVTQLRCKYSACQGGSCADRVIKDAEVQANKIRTALAAEKN